MTEGRENWEKPSNPRIRTRKRKRRNDIGSSCMLRKTCHQRPQIAKNELKCHKTKEDGRKRVLPVLGNEKFKHPYDTKP
jgi:hypothetical protein